jgi:ketosteroid isomerase-like protein
VPDRDFRSRQRPETLGGDEKKRKNGNGPPWNRRFRAGDRSETRSGALRRIDRPPARTRGRAGIEGETTMKNYRGLCLAAFLLLCPALVLAQNSKKSKDSLEQTIRKLDLAQADAILRKDFQALDELCAKDFTVNNPRGEISRGSEAVKDLIRTGVINYASFAREIEALLIHGDTVIVMGRETLVPNENSPQAGQTVRRRYTNVWMKRNGKWLLTARHASVIPAPAP